MATPTATLPPLARKMKAARNATGLSQKAFARLVTKHLPRGYRATRFDIIRWEKGQEPRPLLVKVGAIAAASGKPLDHFLHEVNQEEGSDEDL
jgi:transcriptional regulator with XRE-family HTH domain